MCKSINKENSLDNNKIRRRWPDIECLDQQLLLSDVMNEVGGFPGKKIRLGWMEFNVSRSRRLAKHQVLLAGL